VEKVSVYIPMRDINENGVNFLNVLRAIPRSVLREKQAYIAKLAPSLQYSVVPKRIYDAYDVSQHDVQTVTWAPPFRDAVDVIIEKILDPHTVHPIQGFTDAELLAQVCVHVDLHMRETCVLSA
jgi:hypothetical protein